jgi:hypothetical protein
MYLSAYENAWPGAARHSCDGLIFHRDTADSVASRLGEVMTVPSCISQPGYLKLLPHFFVPSKPISGGKGWISTNAVNPLTVGALNPGFIDPVDHSLMLDGKLDPDLKSLVAKLQSNQAPFDREPYITFRRRNGKVRIALVNLSALPQLTSPRLAEFASGTQTYAGSLAKIAALYAAYQLKFDLNVTTTTNPATFTQNRLNALKKIFDVTNASGASSSLKFDFNNSFRQALDTICKNCDATYVIGSLGFTFMASALWQSGLYDCRRGGVWLGATYGACRGVPRSSWHSDPIGHTSHGATALSVATYFTLLVQKRLIDSASSLGIIANLIRNRVHCRSFFQEGLSAAGKFVFDSSNPAVSDLAVSKIGIYYSHDQPEYYHEGAVIRRRHNGRTLRYVVAVLTQAKPATERIGHRVLYDLIQHLDELVVAA